MRDEDLDRELSALLDGELTPTRARELREKVEADPRLRERLAAFESVDQRLRSLPRSPLPADLRARLQQRIDQLAGRPEREPVPQESLRSRASLARWGAPLAAAVAAGLVAGWLIWPIPVSDESVQLLQVPAQTRVIPEQPAPVPLPESDTAVADLSDEELAIAFELETLRDLDLIRELDLLEALVGMETMEEEGRG